MDADEEAHLSSCIHGYHVYNAIWSATVGEEWQCAKKLGMQRTNMQISTQQGPDVVVSHLKRFLEFPQAAATGISLGTFLLYYKYHTDLITPTMKIKYT